MSLRRRTPRPPSDPSTFIATGAPFQNDGSSRCESNSRTGVPGIPMRTLHPTRRLSSFRRFRAVSHGSVSAGLTVGRPLRCVRWACRQPRCRSARIRSESMRARVAQPGWSTPTTRGVLRGASAGRGWPVRARQLLPAGEHSSMRLGRRRGPEAAERPWRWRRRPAGAARCPSAPASSGLTKSARPGRYRRPRATTIPSGRGAAVVRTDWPGGQFRHQGAAAGRVELGEHIVEEKGRGQARSATTSWWTPMRSARARQRCSPWEACVRASPPFEGQQEVVAVGPHGVDAPSQVVSLRCRGQRVEEVAGPAADVVLADRTPRSGCPASRP